METPEELFAELVDTLGVRPDVTCPGQGPGRGFGSCALRVRGSVFAMLSDRYLVVKLPRGRVADLIAAGTGRPFDAGKGTPMKEWVAIAVSHGATWTSLAGEAYDFVAQASTRAKR